MGNSLPVLALRPSRFREVSVVVITGASSGIGEALAYRYAQRGCKLVLAARSRDKLDQVAEQCRKLGALVVSLPTDVTREAECKRLIDSAISNFGTLDLLILNAGISSHFAFNQGVDVDIYKKLMDTNFYGYLYCTKHAWPYLQKSKGQILVLSSMSAEIGLPERSAYCASKFAVTGFFEALRMEQSDSSSPVSITIVCPPSVKTEMRMHSIKVSGTDDEAIDSLEDKRMPLDKCVATILLAADRRARKVYFPLKSYIAVYARPFIPDVIDPLIRKASRL